MKFNNEGRILHFHEKCRHRSSVFCICCRSITLVQGCRYVLKVGGQSGPVTDKCRWPGSDLGGPDPSSMNHIFNYYFANEIFKKKTVSYFTNCFYCVFLQKN